MTNQTLTKRIIFAVLGALLLAVGLTATIAVDLGVSMFDTATLMTQELFKVESFGNAALILHALYVSLLIIFKRKLEPKWIDIIIAIISVFILTRVINAFEFIANYVNPTTMSATIIIFLISVLVFNIGIYFMAKSNLFVSPYDRFVLQLSWLLKREYGTTRLISDIALFAGSILLIFIFSLDVPISFGTLYIIFTSGLQINLAGKIFKLQDNH